MTMTDFAPYIGGDTATAGPRSSTTVENPATEEIVATVANATAADVTEAVRRATAAQRAWARTPVATRAAALVRLADLLGRDRDRLANLLVREAGKPIRDARGEVGAAIGFCRFFAGIAPVQGGQILPAPEPNQEILLRRMPVGVVGAIIPWNFPLALTLRKLAPALVSGNAIVLKPAELTPLSALAVAELTAEAGIPDGLVSVLPGPGAVIGSALVRAPGVAFVTMTGSVRAGRSILHDAADRIIPVSLELGGNAPFVVFPDADIDTAVAAAVHTRMLNNGQACVANERTYVHADIHDVFVERFAAAMAALRVGDPTDEQTQVGPKISAPELANVERIVDASIAAGARAITGGGRPSGGPFERGHWYSPTVLVDVPSGAPAEREEIFGPVVPITAFRTEDEAVVAANRTEFGLSAYLYTEDHSRVMRMLDALEFGEVYVNRAGPEEVVGFHTGWGDSGLGGDDGTKGLDLYTRTQTVYRAWRGQP